MDLEKNLAHNIKALRERQGVTQEQLAEELHISFQAVSKWENGVSVPDTMMLPKIAQYFGVAIDALFQQKTAAYRNDAIRLLSIYEDSKNQDDFIRADAEFRRLFESGNYDLRDVRAYGVLYEYHMNYCQKKALEQYDRVIGNRGLDAEYYGTRQQKIFLLSRIGRAEESIAEERKNLQEDSETVWNHICLIAAYHYAERYQEGYQAFQEAINKFPAPSVPNELLYQYGGDICRGLKQYEEAFRYWNQALAISDEHIDSLFSIAFSYHELERYGEEVAIWQRIIEWMQKHGFTEGLAFPREQLKAAKEKQLAKAE